MSPAPHGFNQNPSQPWRREAGLYFSRGGNNKLKWPARINMVSEKHKLLFTPIAKCACTSLKTMMVQLAQSPHTDHILRLGIHRVTDEFNTGMHLKDLPESRALEISSGEDFYKFAVVRDPLKRCISAYTDKFLANRLDVANQQHTGKVVRAVQATSNPDMARGITFREFVQFLVSQPPSELDPHWAPQHFSLASIPRYDRIFRVDQMAELKAALEEWTGVEIKLDKLNASLSSPNASGLDDLLPNEVVDLAPGQLQERGELHSSMFMAADLVSDLEQYYAQDVELYQSTFESSGSYRPRPSTLNHAANPTHSSGGSVRAYTWNKLQLYSKGLLGLKADGVGSTHIAIINGNDFSVDAQQFTQLRLETRLYGRDEKALAIEPQIHPVELEIPASGQKTPRRPLR
jgi:hypothetical protein